MNNMLINLLIDDKVSYLVIIGVIMIIMVHDEQNWLMALSNQY